MLMFFVAVAISITVVNGQACRRADNNALGRCLSVYDCPPALRMLQNGLSNAQTDQLRRLQCQGDRGRYPWICCAPDDNDAATPPTTMAAPTDQSDDISSRRRKGHNAPVSRGGALAAYGTCGREAFGQKIYGGNATGLNEFPWMALLQYRHAVTGARRYFCGGSLINSRYILTAAHCVVNDKKEQVLTAVRLGEYDLSTAEDCVESLCSDPVVDVRVVESIAHPDYDKDARNQLNDIALLRLDRDVPFTEFIQPICMPSTVRMGRSAPGVELWAAGWGQTLEVPQSAQKLKVSVPIAEQAECRRTYGRLRAAIMDSQLCAGGGYRVDTCYGDSGGPLMRQERLYWAQEAIVSFGNRCGLEGWPAVYTRVESYEDWIRENIRD